MSPITIRCGSFVCTLNDTEDFITLPLRNVRKLWKIMFSAEYENRDTIQTLRDWLPQTVTDSGVAMWEEQKSELRQAPTVLRYSEKQAKDAKARHERVKKLQTIFHDISKN